MKVAIVGYGVEGESSYNYFAKQGADITIFDESEQPKFAVPQDATLIAGKGALNKLHGYDIIMRVPPLRPERLKTDGVVSSVTQEFFKACPAPIIGVTASKGKGTTSTLIFDMLTQAGVTAHIAGNIGVPALDILPQVKKDHVVVLELSSFQLWDLKTSPHVAVVGMIEPEHLDVHLDVEEYLQAKANLVRWQKSTDITIYLPDNELTKKVAMLGKGKKIPYTQSPGAVVKNGNFAIGKQVICPVSDLQIPGRHNQDNTCAAITAAWQFTQNVIGIAKAIAAFEGLEHRLKFVKELRDVRYFDDSIGTTPGSAIAALRAFSQPKVVILGGSDKGADFTELAKEVADQNVRTVVAIGAMRSRITKALQSAKFAGQIEQFDEKSTMQQIVAKCAQVAVPGDVVVLSPACASFDMFKSYKDRGEKFIAAVNALS